MPKVSVILTSLNHSGYISRAINSVLEQTWEDFELIIWDDASSDDSWKIISSYSDSRIRAIRNERTRRGISNINDAVRHHASGEYICIHHSDDIWLPRKLHKQVSTLNSNRELTAVFCIPEIIDENDLPVENDWFDAENQSRHAWLRELFQGTNRLCHPSTMIRKEFLLQAGLYRYLFAQLGDADMWTRLLRLGDIHVLQEKLVQHRLFSDKSNTSGLNDTKRSRLAYEWLKILENYQGLDITELKEIFPEARDWIPANSPSAEFVLAMCAIQYGNMQANRLFGLNILYQLLSDEKSAARIREIHGFDYLDFILLTGEQPLFSTELARELEIARKRSGQLEQTLAELHRSFLWKASWPLRRLLGMSGKLLANRTKR